MADKILEIQLFSQALYVRSLVPKGSKHCSKSLSSRTVCQINVFCVLRRNSIWPPKNGGKVIFAKSHQYTLQIPCRSKILSKSLSHRFQDECTFALYAEIQEGCQKWQESNFCEKVASRLCIYLVGQKILSKSLYHSPFP